MRLTPRSDLQNGEIRWLVGEDGGRRRDGGAMLKRRRHRNPLGLGRGIHSVPPANAWARLCRLGILPLRFDQIAAAACDESLPVR